MFFIIMLMCVVVVNACNYNEDYSSSVKYLQQLIHSAGTVYPANFPETAMYVSALALAYENMFRAMAASSAAAAKMKDLAR